MGRRRAVFMALFVALGPGALWAQSPEDSEDVWRGARVAPTLRALRITGGAPAIDGLLDESDWRAATVARDFVEFEPDEGTPPSQRTEARVLYGPEALYVGIRAYDDRPDSIVAQLARRDEVPYSDWVQVVIDSHHDLRTAYRFSVNPAGVKGDGYHFNDTEEDDSWDAVWDVATRIDDEGWTAEFRIPYSQLRFGGAAEQTWGINFARKIARHQETSLWAPLSRGDGAVVSRFGRLEGLSNLAPPRRVEVLPYSLVRMERAPGDPSDPFYEPRAYFSTVGADVKYGLTTDLTLDLTINPDFGQVEADPAEVNLSAFESFFQERRPFFVEGADIFSFRFSEGDGEMENEGLFYSRRIGRPPRGGVPAGTYADPPDRTTILGAMKLSGKTSSGWSLGLLNSVTGSEKANLADAAGPIGTWVVEPLTHYGVGRVQKDFRAGRSAVGAISTWTRRSTGEADELALHRGAYTAGIDTRHRFGRDRFQVRAYLLGSTVRGSTEAIGRTQLSPARYFQRPDAAHTEFDPSRTSLSGWAGSVSFAKMAGGYWRYGTGIMARSPGFEPNDIGFMRETDFVSPWLWAGYNHYTPSRRLQRWSLNGNAWSSYSFGGERYNLGGNINGSLTLNNFWSAYAGVMRNEGGLSGQSLRGGPMLRRDGHWGGWFGLSSDSRNPLQLRAGSHWGLQPATGSWNYGANANLQWRPSSRATVALGPFMSWRVEDLQWVGRFDLDQATSGITVRADWTFSPTLSLQLYAQPFVSAGGYGAFKRITDPTAPAYRDRFEAVTAGSQGGGQLQADLNGDGTPEAFTDPAFNVGQFRSNLVLRWEYQPGSALFLVWSQGRSHYARTGDFSLGGDLRTLLDQPREDVVMLKINYWIG